MTEEQFNNIYLDHKHKLGAYVYGILKDTQHTEEIVQEVFSRLYRQKQQLKLEDEPARWLFVVGRNLSFKHLRKSKRTILISDTFKVNDISARTSNTDSTLIFLQSIASNSADDMLAKSPLELLTEDEQQYLCVDKISEALGKLPAKQQQILKLRYFQEMTYGEIAKAMEITEGNAGFLLHTAKKKLKKAYNALNLNTHGR